MARRSLSEFLIRPAASPSSPQSGPQSPPTVTVYPAVGESPPSYYGFETDVPRQRDQHQQQSAAGKLKDKTFYLVKDTAGKTADKTAELAGKTADKTVELTGKTVDAVKGLVKKDKDKDVYKSPM